MKCSICGKEIKGCGNNSQPVTKGTCCDKCNNEIVVPLRIIMSDTSNTNIYCISTSGLISIYKYSMNDTLLKQLQNLVGGYIEIYPYDNSKYYLLVDEEGLLKRATFNLLAYQLFGIQCVGNLVLCPKVLFDDE